MKVGPTWTTIMGLMAALIVGCGSTDNPIAEEAPEPPTDSPTNIVSPILGDWRLMDIIWFKDGVVTGQIDGAGWIYGADLNILTFAPDGIFSLTQRFPIQEEVLLDILEWKGKGHIREFIVTFKGKYHIGVNQLRFNLIVTRVEPREEVLKYNPGLENSVFLYEVWFNDGRAMDYIFTDNGNQLELSREQGEWMVKFIHRRPKTEQNTS